MKNRFVKFTLFLVMLLVMAVPTQAFAATNDCTTNQTTVSKTTLSKIYSQLPQSSINKLMGTLTQFSGGKIDMTQLQNLLKQYTDGKTTIKTPTPAPATPTTPTTPAKPTTPATPAKPTTPDTTTPPASSTIGDYEQQVVNLVNQERAKAGLPALKVNTKLSAVAEKKAEDMRDKGYFSHTSPTYGSPFDMMKQFGISYTTAGENIAMGQKTPAAVMDGWMNSSGHRANILNANYTEIGVGYVTASNGTTYWVQHFIKP